MGPLTPIIGLRLLALAAGLRHNAEIGQPGLCFSAYGHKFGINHLAAALLGELLDALEGPGGNLVRRLVGADVFVHPQADELADAEPPAEPGPEPDRLRHRTGEVL